MLVLSRRPNVTICPQKINRTEVILLLSEVIIADLGLKPPFHFLCQQVCKIFPAVILLDLSYGDQPLNIINVIALYSARAVPGSFRKT